MDDFKQQKKHAEPGHQKCGWKGTNKRRSNRHARRVLRLRVRRSVREE